MAKLSGTSVKAKPSLVERRAAKVAKAAPAGKTAKAVPAKEKAVAKAGRPAKAGAAKPVKPVAKAGRPAKVIPVAKGKKEKAGSDFLL